METQKLVHFRRENDGISQRMIQKVANKANECGLSAIYPFSVDKIVIADWVNLKCRYGCQRYNKSWCCPPATPGPREARAILNDYHLALLLVAEQSCADFYRDNNRKRINQIRYWKGALSLERFLFLEGYYKVFSLVGECCALCKECAYPDNCRFPQEKRPSIESFSIDVIGTLQNLGSQTTVKKQIGDNFNSYGIILVE